MANSMHLSVPIFIATSGRRIACSQWRRRLVANHTAVCYHSVKLNLILKNMPKQSSKIPKRECDRFFKLNGISLPMWIEGDLVFIAAKFVDGKDAIVTFPSLMFDHDDKRNKVKPEQCDRVVSKALAESCFNLFALKEQPKEYWN